MWDWKKTFNTRRIIVAKPNRLVGGNQVASTSRVPVSTTYRPTGWLGPTLHVKGEITGSDDLLIDGSVEGTIRLDDRSVILGAAAKVEADISARDVVVSGHVTGNVCATRTIQIRKHASVLGNLVAAEVVIENGADFKGSLEIEGGEISRKSKPAGAPLATSSADAGLTTNDSSQAAWN